MFFPLSNWKTGFWDTIWSSDLLRQVRNARIGQIFASWHPNISTRTLPEPLTSLGDFKLKISDASSWFSSVDHWTSLHVRVVSPCWFAAWEHNSETRKAPKNKQVNRAHSNNFSFTSKLLDLSLNFSILNSEGEIAILLFSLTRIFAMPVNNHLTTDVSPGGLKPFRLWSVLTCDR